MQINMQANIRTSQDLKHLTCMCIYTKQFSPDDCLSSANSYWFTPGKMCIAYTGEPVALGQRLLDILVMRRNVELS